MGLCLKFYKEEKRKVKRCIYQSKEEVQEQFGRKMNQDVNGNRKLFWKEMSNANGGEVENSNLLLLLISWHDVCQPGGGRGLKFNK